MKLLIRTISLLLICGLMASFYQNHTYIIGMDCKTPAKLKVQPVKKSLDCKLNDTSFSFYKDVLANILPVLKSLN
jgi:hypothetical protein